MGQALRLECYDEAFVKAEYGALEDSGEEGMFRGCNLPHTCVTMRRSGQSKSCRIVCVEEEQTNSCSLTMTS